MPLHDWTDETNWEDLHGYWVVRLADHIRPRLPEGYRLRLGSLPRLDIGGGGHPDLSVRHTPPEAVNGSAPAGPTPEPDSEVAVAAIKPGRAIFVQKRGEVVAVVELVSPGNKDRPSARDYYTARYAGYLAGRVNLLLIDLLPRPHGFSFADAVAAEVGIPDEPPVPAPFAVSYRVGEPAAAGGSYVAVWRRPLAAGRPLPAVPLPLTVHQSVMVDLEATYREAAASAYLT